jgi:SAM-dependent methyltransferase
VTKKNSPLAIPNPSAIENTRWSPADVISHYSYQNPHSDLYSFLGQWSDLGSYLNVGYSNPGERHWSPKSHLRLVERVASGLLAIYKSGLSKSSPDSSKHSPLCLLDIASGRGGPAIYAHQHYGLSVLGIDLTPFNVSCSIRNAADRHLSEHLTFICGDATQLPIKDGKYPMAWSIESPAHFRDKHRFLKEAARVLQPGGVLAFADLLVVERIVMASRRNRKIYEDFLEAWDAPNLLTIRKYRTALADAEFELCDLEVATSRNLRHFEWYCRNLGFLFKTPVFYRIYKGIVKESAGVDLDGVRDLIVKSYRALRLGLIDYGIFWAVKHP